MISKSVKRKRRQNAKFHHLTSSIQTKMIDDRGSQKFYLVSLPLRSDYALHKEAYGERACKSKYRELVRECKALAAA